MNAGVMFFAVSMLLKHFTPAALGLTVLCILGMFLASKAKEREWRERYRVKWEKYEKRTKAFIPGVY
jgi:protein-S-isoprenylcysteine O-methyltransferase Ste14